MTMEIGARWRIEAFDEPCVVCGLEAIGQTATLVKARPISAKPRDGIVQDNHVVALCRVCLRSMIDEIDG